MKELFSIQSCGRQNNVPKDVHTLTFRICYYISSYGKRDFADEIKIKNFIIGRLFCISHLGLNQSHWPLKVKRRKVRCKDKKKKNERFNMLLLMLNMEKRGT